MDFFRGSQPDDEESKQRQQHESCLAFLERSKTRAPLVAHMLTAMEKLGVPITEDIYVCRPCSEPAMGGFVPEEGIVLCQNNIRRQAYMDATLAHELIHAYDYAKFDIAWDNCRHHACSEVRAANLSGDCYIKQELANPEFKYLGNHKRCVRRRAIESLKMNPDCHDKAREHVDHILEACMRKWEPYERIP